MASLLLLAAVALSAVSVSAENATIFNMTHVPDWQKTSLMALQITAPEGDAAPISYEVYPLTASLGLNQTARERGAVWLRGNIVNAANDGYLSQVDKNSVVYLCCDPANSTEEINEIMTNEPERPLAILLYSIAGDCCALEGSDLTYETIFTMASSLEARETLNYTHTGAGIATITGNVNATEPDDQNGQGGSNSAVAMSILYSITGLITLLFLIIIATGAIRAHRYPERYGPRSGYGGRPRQSRAKGLARAVLETLPIVKFGDPDPPKPDPALELEHQPSRSSHDPATGTRLSAIPEEPKTPRKRQSEAVPPMITAATSQDKSATGSGENTASTSVIAGAGSAITHGPNDEHLGCSICTEDFTVGEDVRVLPCDHKFHPPCIDPWLINVSGTCPLCRLDLRPQGSDKQGPPGSSDSEEAFSQQLPPPLAGDLSEQQQQHESNGSSSGGGRRRHSRLLDLQRLRHASVEERIEILRLHRTQSQQHQRQQQQQRGEETEREEGRRARLTDRLRDKFRIRTTQRGHSPPGGGTRGTSTQASGGEVVASASSS
ncbi:hypothetical protein B0H66DRAFT_340860 [Apodospora peruviana]|uniref:RING-type E3 ubiquitin transferase n=1 Tax=Apodospora peruviana TaxID=516989 RepID=A0AAE0HYP3_9PEZI|nr:hypothetical protein B0H66DRAFT_340860 [Apodospora peruviana]